MWKSLEQSQLLVMNENTLIAFGNSFIAVYTPSTDKILLCNAHTAFVDKDFAVLPPVGVGKGFQDLQKIVSLDVDCKDTISWCAAVVILL